MSEQLRYAGREILDAAMARMGASDEMSLEDVLRLHGALGTALGKGVPFDVGLRALGEFLTSVAGGLLPVPWTEIDPEWAAAMLRADNALEMGRWLPLLPPDEQLAACLVKDRLFSRTLIELPAAKLQAVASAFIKRHPLPAPSTAAVALQLRPEPTSLAEAATVWPLVEMVQNFALEPFELWIAAQRKLQHYMWLHQRLLAAEGKEANALRGLDEKDRWLTRVLGADFAADKAGLLDFRGRANAKDAQQKLLVELAGFRYVSPGVAKGAYHYVHARAYAATGDFRKSVKLFRKALDIGFSPIQTSLYLAFMLNARKKRDEAREVLEEAARRLLWLRGGAAQDPTLRDMYVKFGGELRSLGAAAPWAAFTDAARSNAERLRNLGRPRLASRREEATKAFWSERTRKALRMVLHAARSEDFDAAFGDGAGDGLARLDPVEASAVFLDSVPGLEPMERDVLVRAANDGVDGATFAREILRHLELREADGATLPELIEAAPGYGSSTAVARERMEIALGEGVAAAVAVLDLYADRGSLPPAALSELFLAVAPAARKDGDADTVARYGEALLAAADHDAAPGVRAAVLELLWTALDETEKPTAAVDVAERIVRASDERTAVCERLAVWALDRAGDADHVAATPASLTLLEGLAEVTGGAFAAPLRERAFAALRIQLSRTSPSANPRALVAKLRAGAAERATTDETIATWFEEQTRRLDTAEAMETSVDFGEWLRQTVDPPQRPRLRLAVRTLLDALVEAAVTPAERLVRLQELARFAPDDPQVAERLATQKKEILFRNLKIGGAVGAGVVLLVVLLAVFLFP